MLTRSLAYVAIAVDILHCLVTVMHATVCTLIQVYCSSYGRPMLF